MTETKAMRLRRRCLPAPLFQIACFVYGSKFLLDAFILQGPYFGVTANGTVQRSAFALLALTLYVIGTLPRERRVRRWGILAAFAPMSRAATTAFFNSALSWESRTVATTTWALLAWSIAFLIVVPMPLVVSDRA